MSFFDKELADITIDDLNVLIKEKISEDEFLEYKKTLSANKADDKWITGADSIGEKAVTNLAKEIIAFANTSGGYLILGMAEEGRVKPFASKLNPIPRIVELSEKLKHIFRNIIEPTLNNIQYHSIKTNENDGVLIIRIQKSYLSPHRSLNDKECYIRRNDSSEKMTMREIKDLTLLTIQSNDRIDKIFTERMSNFEKAFTEKTLPYRYDREQDKNRLGLRITILPINNEFIINDVYQKFNFLDFKYDHHLKIKVDEDEIFTKLGVRAESCYPILRGLRFFGDCLNFEILENGIVEATFIDIKYDNNIWSPLIHIKWLFETLYRSLLIVEKIKSDFIKFNFEVGIEIQMLSTNEKMNLADFSHANIGFLTLNKNNILFPRYSYLDSSEIDKLITIISKDFYNVCEKIFTGELKTIFQSKS